MKKEAILSKIRSEKGIALIRAISPDGLLDCARALAAGGPDSVGEFLKAGALAAAAAAK